MTGDRFPPPSPEQDMVEVVARRRFAALEPPATRWIFPAEPPDAPGRARDDEPGEQARMDEIVGVGADLEPGTLLSAYRTGVFPMPVGEGYMGWWSPDPRGVIPLDGLRVTRSLRKSCARFTIRIDTAFEQVIDHCADRRRPGGWIDPDVRAAYIRLHRWGWAHSVEAWDHYDRLAGGLYGVAVGGLFAGESMFHRQTDASKVALVGLVDLMNRSGASLLDVQWATPHLRSVGAVELRRGEYLERLAAAITLPQPEVFGG
jgi:leucyl/phenylalanyl-tRNA--protein transferase